LMVKRLLKALLSILREASLHTPMLSFKPLIR
jgi:hypothetical protein